MTKPSPELPGGASLPDGKATGVQNPDNSSIFRSFSRRILLKGAVASLSALYLKANTSRLLAAQEVGNAAEDLVADTDAPFAEGIEPATELNQPSAAFTGEDAAVEKTLTELTQEGYVLTNSFENPETIRRQFNSEEIINYDGLEIKGSVEFRKHMQEIMEVIKKDPVAYRMIKDNLTSFEMADTADPEKQQGPLIEINDKYGEGSAGAIYDPDIDRNFIYNKAAKIVSAARTTQMVEEGNPYGRLRKLPDQAQLDRFTNNPYGYVPLFGRESEEAKKLGGQVGLSRAQVVRDFMMNPAVEAPDTMKKHYQQQYDLIAQHNPQT